MMDFHVIHRCLHVVNDLPILYEIVDQSDDQRVGLLLSTGM